QAPCCGLLIQGSVSRFTRLPRPCTNVRPAAKTTDKVRSQTSMPGSQLAKLLVDPSLPIAAPPDPSVHQTARYGSSRQDDRPKVPQPGPCRSRIVVEAVGCVDGHLCVSGRKQRCQTE